jgi:uncharacterized protein YbaR (Trm112 family)
VNCHRVYPIRDEIPVMLVDEAIIEEIHHEKHKEDT